MNAPEYTNGLTATLAAHGYTLTDQYAWCLPTPHELILFIELDLRDESEGTAGVDGNIAWKSLGPQKYTYGARNVQHHSDWLAAVSNAWLMQRPVRILETKHTRYSDHPTRPVMARLLPGTYRITNYTGTGYVDDEARVDLELLRH